MAHLTFVLLNLLQIDGKTFAKPSIADKYERLPRRVFTMFYGFTIQPKGGEPQALESCSFLKRHEGQGKNDLKGSLEDVKLPKHQDILFEAN